VASRIRGSDFDDTGGAPSSATDVLGVYDEVAANMAMSYFVGLDDVHHENILVKKGGVPIIDMEATTGTFRKQSNPNLGGFYDGLCNEAIYEGVGVELVQAIEVGSLTGLPKGGDVQRRRVERWWRSRPLASTPGYRATSTGSCSSPENTEDETATRTPRQVPVPAERERARPLASGASLQ
jgi:hypothetical protein